MFGLSLALAVSSLLAADQQGDRPHVLVAAAEALVQRDLGDAASIVIRSALASPGLTRTERARLRLADAARLASANDEAGAKKHLGDALSLDPMVTFEFPVSTRLKELLEDARSLLPTTSGPPSPSSSIGREKPAAAIVRIVDLLGTNAQTEAADIVLQVGWRYSPFTVEEQVQLGVRRGTVKADQFDDVEARKAFRSVLELDRTARLPDWAPPKTVRQFDDLRAELSLPAPPPPPSPRPSAASSESKPAPPAKLAAPSEAEGSHPNEVPSTPRNVITLNTLPLAASALGLANGQLALILQVGYERVLHRNVTVLVYIFGVDFPDFYELAAAGLIRIYFFGTAPAGLYLAAGQGVLITDVTTSPILSPLSTLPISFVGYQHVFGNRLILGGGLGGFLLINNNGMRPVPYAEISCGYAF